MIKASADSRRPEDNDQEASVCLGDRPRLRRLIAPQSSQDPRSALVNIWRTFMSDRLSCSSPTVCFLLPLAGMRPPALGLAWMRRVFAGAFVALEQGSPC